MTATFMISSLGSLLSALSYRQPAFGYRPSSLDSTASAHRTATAIRTPSRSHLLDLAAVALDQWIAKSLVGTLGRERPCLSRFAGRQVELEVLALPHVL